MQYIIIPFRPYVQRYMNFLFQIWTDNLFIIAYYIVAICNVVFLKMFDKEILNKMITYTVVKLDLYDLNNLQIH